MWSNGIKIAFFQKNRPAAGGFATKPTSVIRLSYASLFNMTRKVKYLHFLTISSSFLPIARSWLSGNRPQLQIFHSVISSQKVPRLKIYDDAIASDLWFGPLPIKNPDYAYRFAAP